MWTTKARENRDFGDPKPAPIMELQGGQFNRMAAASAHGSAALLARI